jgi:hypothetical protein
MRMPMLVDACASALLEIDKDVRCVKGQEPGQKVNTAHMALPHACGCGERSSDSGFVS